ncbi:YbjN domain-containing protein [Vulcaniibacterium gelatinicum]|uniref:YbjN domain-containing protein n=1 Tax=Vulcaniibacterium gelatinicum TaxID=2598725 RepID=UPI0015F2DA53|nr:YbjN domain-containing protein [Vulcaniibacterium gelatinicum]
MASALAAVLGGIAVAGAAERGRGITGAEMVEILQDEGYRARLVADRDGDPQIETRMSGVNVFVHFYDCERGRCGSLQFSVGLDLEQGSTLEVVNAFNREFRYTRAYLDDERDPFLEYDFEVLHTDHAAHVASQIELWEQLLGEFLDATGFRDEAEDEDEAPEGGGRSVSDPGSVALTD